MSNQELVYLDEPNQFIEAAARTLLHMLQHKKLGPVLREKNRSGGFLCISGLDGAPRLVVQIGACDREKIPDFLKFSQEKAARLAANPTHVLSRQSEDESREMYPGAVRGSSRIYSFSGLPGHVDELLSMSVATRSRDLTRKNALWMLSTYPNKYAYGTDTDYVYL